MRTATKRGEAAIRLLRLAVRAQDDLMDANAAVDWSRAEGSRAWEAAVRLRRATRLAARMVERFADEVKR